MKSQCMQQAFECWIYEIYITIKYTRIPVVTFQMHSRQFSFNGTRNQRNNYAYFKRTHI